MCNPIAAVAAMAVMAAGQAYMQSEQQRAQLQYQSNLEESRAVAMRQQADLEAQKGAVEQRRQDMERDRISRDYQTQAAKHRSLLASGNVDMTSGSAADFLLGNAALFGEDMAANRLNWNLAGWQAKENARQAGYQSALLGSQSSWLSQSAGGIENSLLAGGLAGGKTVAAGYLMGGFGKAAPSGGGVNTNPYWGANPHEPY